MTGNLELVKSTQFNGVTFDCYKDTYTNDNTDFWATREQIGQLLEYETPNDAIYRIHERHKDRLNNFSTIDKTSSVEGNRTVTRDVILYNFKGLLEICRYSNQPKADAVMDFLWEIADEIRRTGSYSTRKELNVLPAGVLEGAKFILETADIKGNQLTLALDKVYQSYTGKSLLLTANIQLDAPVKEQALTPTQIAETLQIGKGNSGAKMVNALLENAGYQHKISHNWEPTELGKKYSVMIDANKKHSNGTPVRQLKWNSGIIKVVKNLVKQLAQ